MPAACSKKSSVTGRVATDKSVSNRRIPSGIAARLLTTTRSMPVGGTS